MTECRWCGETHLKGVCPKVKAIEFASDGETVKRVEFMTPRDCMPANGWPLPANPFAPGIWPPPFSPTAADPTDRWRNIGLASHHYDVATSIGVGQGTVDPNIQLRN